MRASAHMGLNPWSRGCASPLPAEAQWASSGSACLTEKEMQPSWGPHQGPERCLSYRRTNLQHPPHRDPPPAPCPSKPHPCHSRTHLCALDRAEPSAGTALRPSSPGRAAGPGPPCSPPHPSCKALEERGTEDPRGCPGLGSLSALLSQISRLGLSLLDRGVPKVTPTWGPGEWFSPGLF